MRLPFDSKKPASASHPKPTPATAQALGFNEVSTNRPSGTVVTIQLHTSVGRRAGGSSRKSTVAIAVNTNEMNPRISTTDARMSSPTKMLITWWKTGG